MKKLFPAIAGIFIYCQPVSAQDMFTYLAEFQTAPYYGFADSAGNTKTPGRYNLIMKPVEGICKVWAGQTSSADYNNIKYGYCFPDGTELVAPQYRRGEDFSDGLAMVGSGDFTKGVFVGYINKKGLMQIPMIYKGGKAFSEGLAPVSADEKKWQYIDKNGAVAIAGPFLDADVFSEGLACVSIPHELGHGVTSFRRGYIDRSGKTIITPQYNYGTPFKNGFAVVSETGSVNGATASYQLLIDRTGKRITTDPYIMIQAAGDGLWAVKIKGGFGLNSNKDEWGLIDRTGKLYPPRFPYAPISREGLINFAKDGLSGFMDKTGKEIVAPVYKSVYVFSEGLAAVQTREGLWGYINKKGEVVVKPAYAGVGSFSDGLAIVSTGKDSYDPNRLTGAIDKAGKVIIPFEARKLGSFQNGKAIADDSGVSYYVYKNGKSTIACSVKALLNARYGYTALAKNDVRNALSSFEQPENKDCPVSDYWLGYIYLQVQGEMRDSVKGARLMEQAANKGYPEAMYSLGFIYANGLAGKKDELLARQWLTKAAKAGVASANTLLGNLCEKNNPAEAAKYYQKAAEQFESVAIYNLALLYREGRGVAKDEALFRSWLNLAVQRQYQPAKALQGSLNKKE